MNPTQSKQQALDLFEEHRKAYLSHARDVAERIFYAKGHVTTDDVREECPVPSMFSAKVLGAVFNKERWESTGFTQTKIKTSHGRVVRVWVLKREYRKARQAYSPVQLALL